ncbi:MAG: sterol desaturase family protein [Sandaracinus sp.]|nr:sterol desaturase family protein [Sandaracinus sp.]
MSHGLSLAIALFLGALTWTLLEYCIHRWLGHDAKFRPNPFAKEHIRHHSQGDYFAPTLKKMGAALVALALVTPPAILVAGVELGVAYALGLVGFYGVYEVLHRREHTSRGFGAYGRWARRHHFWHHFGDSSKNHGVTSPIWDFVFGTYQAPGVIVVPERLKMQWLTDPETGDVFSDLQAWYSLRRRRAAA